MNRPPRLPYDDPDALRAALFRHARLDGPSERARRRVLESVAAAGVVTAGAGLLAVSAVKQGAGVSTAKIGSLVVAKWALSGALMATAALGVRETVIHVDAGHAPAHATPTAERAPGQRGEHGAPVAVAASSTVLETRRAPDDTLPPLAPEARSFAAPAPAETVYRSMPPAAQNKKGVNGSAPDLPSTAATAGSNPDQAAAVAPRVDPVSVGLSHELALLERARAHLAQQTPLSALDVLRDYERSFPAGALRIEAWALRVEALAAAGYRREAAIQARSFLAAHSANPMAHRVRTLLLSLETNGR